MVYEREVSIHFSCLTPRAVLHGLRAVLHGQTPGLFEKGTLPLSSTVIINLIATVIINIMMTMIIIIIIIVIVIAIIMIVIVIVIVKCSVADDTFATKPGCETWIWNLDTEDTHRGCKQSCWGLLLRSYYKSGRGTL